MNKGRGKGRVREVYDERELKRMMEVQWTRHSWERKLKRLKQMIERARIGRIRVESEDAESWDAELKERREEVKRSRVDFQKEMNYIFREGKRKVYKTHRLHYKKLIEEKKRNCWKRRDSQRSGRVRKSSGSPRRTVD